MYNEGISKTGDILDLAVENEVVAKSGAFYKYNDQNIGQGRENAKRYLKDNPEIMEEIEKKVRSILFGEEATTEEADQEQQA